MINQPRLHCPGTDDDRYLRCPVKLAWTVDLEQVFPERPDTEQLVINQFIWLLVRPFEREAWP